MFWAIPSNDFSLASPRCTRTHSRQWVSLNSSKAQRINRSIRPITSAESRHVKKEELLFCLVQELSFTVIPAMKDSDSNGGPLTNLARRWRKRLTQAQPEADSQETFFSPPPPAKGSSVVATAIVPMPSVPAPVEESPTDPKLTADQAEALRKIDCLRTRQLLERVS